MDNDKSLREVLNALATQNKANLALQALQVKYNRENAGEDNDRREKQLQEVAGILERVEAAVTGLKVQFDIKPLQSVLDNHTQLLQKSLEEQSLIRKLTEGSLQYDKESAQYRNTSGREIESKISGKEIKKGGYVDFETAADRLTGQGKRVRESEANQLNLKAIPLPKTDLGKLPLGIASKEEKEGSPSLGNLRDLSESVGSRLSGAYKFLTKDVKERGLFGKQSKDVEKKAEEVLTPTGVTGVNPEADNIQSTQEVIAETAKQDVELTKENNQLLEQQVAELKKISEALAPKTPSELPPQDKLKPTTGSAAAAEGGGGIGEALSDLGGLGKGAKALGKGAASLGSKAVKFLGSKGGMVAGGALAIGAGALSAYQGISEAETNKQAKLDDIQSKVDSGQMSPEQAAAARKEVGNTATVEKSSAAGGGVGMAGGAIAGMKAGAALGTMFGGPIGTAIGTVAGGALGAFAGSKAGEVVGEYAGKGINAIKGFFGGGEASTETVKPSSEVQPEAKAPDENSKTYMDAYAKARDSGAGVAEAKQIASDAVKASSERKQMEQGAPEPRAKGGPVEDGADYIVGEKGPELFMPFKDGVVVPNDLSKKMAPMAIKGGKAGLATGGIALAGGITDYNQLSEKGKSYHKFKLQLSNLMSIRGPGGGGIFEDIDPELKKKQEDFIKAGEELGGNIDPAEKKFVDEVFASNIQAARSEKDVGDLQSRFKDDVSSNVAPASSPSTGASIAQISTENSDLTRQASMDKSSGQPIISSSVNNVNTTSFTPIKPSPRPDFNGSALDRYQSRVAVY